MVPCPSGGPVWPPTVGVQQQRHAVEQLDQPQVEQVARVQRLEARPRRWPARRTPPSSDVVRVELVPVGGARGGASISRRLAAMARVQPRGRRVGVEDRCRSRRSPCRGRPGASRAGSQIGPHLGVDRRVAERRATTRPGAVRPAPRASGTSSRPAWAASAGRWAPGRRQRRGRGRRRGSCGPSGPASTGRPSPGGCGPPDRHAAQRRLDARQPAQRRRDADRAAAVGAGAQRHHARGEGGTRPARRATGAARRGSTGCAVAPKGDVGGVALVARARACSSCRRRRTRRP